MNFYGKRTVNKADEPSWANWSHEGPSLPRGWKAKRTEINLRDIWKRSPFVSASDLSDESLLRYYDAIRKQVEADRDSKHKLVGGDAIKE